MPSLSHLSDRQLRDQVINLVHVARGKLPDNSSAFDIEKHYSLQVCEEEMPLDKEGAYIEDQAKIIINKLITSDERRRFTLFHELVHHLIRLDGDLYSYLHEIYTDDSIFDRTIELLCNIGAAEFILPREQVREVIENEGFSLQLLLKFCEERKVSGPAALIQLIQCAPNKCYGVICEYGFSPNSNPGLQQAFVQQTTGQHLYILQAMWSPSAEYPIARFTRIPDNHILASGLLDKNPINGVDRIPFRSGREWRVPCEVQFFRQNVYGIFHASSPPNPMQPRLF